MLPLQGVRRRDLAGRADAALHAFVLDESLDNRRIALRDAFYGEYLRAVTKRREVDARADRDVVYDDCAGATDTDGTALLRPGEPRGADHVEEDRVGLDLELPLLVVQNELDVQDVLSFKAR